MHDMIKAGLCTRIVAMALAVFVAQAQPAAAGEREDLSAQWREENIREFQAWREGIPDYERRLYDRVKAVNKDLLDLKRILVIVGGLLILGIPASLWLILARQGIKVSGAVAGAIPAGAVSAAPKDLAAAMQRQRQLEMLIARLAAAVEVHNTQLSSFQQERVELDALLAECRTMADDVGRQLHAEKA
jgi:hypothetical protein